MLLAVTDFMTTRVPKVQNAIYILSFLTIYTLFTIKYFYGADMLNYYNYYVWAPPMDIALWHPDRYFFEQGYTVLNTLFANAHLSFYWFTVAISTFYFFTIALLFRQIPRMRTFALMMLVVLDYNLIFAAFRQAISVGFFILMVLALQKRKYIFAVLSALLTIWMHKSGIFAISMTLVFYLIYTPQVKKWCYEVLLLILCLMLVLPLAKLSAPLDAVPWLNQFSASISHHLLLGRRIQSIFIIYFILMLVLAYYHRFYSNGDRTRTLAIFALMGCATIAVLYPYYFLLNRLKSYFLPLLIVYSFRFIQQAQDEREHLVPYGKLLTQTACLLFFVYAGHMTYAFNQSSKQLHSPIYNTCTVFDLIHHSPGEIQARQLRIAERWWALDHERGLNDNRID